MCVIKIKGKICMINSVNGSNFQPITKVAFKQYQQSSAEIPQAPMQYDAYMSSQNTKMPPEIGFFRLMSGFLTDNQVNQINQSRRLPSNAKFIMNGYGSYSISNNILGVRVGTQTLPEGFEVKKNVLGQAVVLPKGSEGLFIR